MIYDYDRYLHIRLNNVNLLSVVKAKNIVKNSNNFGLGLHISFCITTFIVLLNIIRACRFL